jgi:hypothetical protein
MRVYLAATAPALASAWTAGRFPADGSSGQPGHAVTAALREWYIEGDEEELEFAALTEAAHASLRLIAADPAAPSRRLVVAADVHDRDIVAGGALRSSVTLTAAVLVAAVVSVHVDEPEAAAAVRAAAAALGAAEAGDDDAAFLVEEAQACDLLWYDATEVAGVLAGLMGEGSVEWTA